MPLFQATVSGGLEDLAAEEMMEKLGIPAANIRALPSLGRLYFHYGESGNLESIKDELCSLRCVCHLYVVVLLHPNFFTEGAPREELLKLHPVAHLGRDAVSDIIISSEDTPLSPESDAVFGCGWQQAVEIWKSFFPEHKKSIPFRVTGDRKCTSGHKQQFTSLEAAVEIGGQLQERFEWEVNLSNFQLEVLCAIRNQTLAVSIALTEASLSRRVTEHLGTTHLSGHVAYAMIMLCRLKPGELVVDTMCGGGSLGISAGLARKDVFSLNGDVDGRCAKRTLLNSNEREAATMGGRVQVVRWDARCLPLRTDSVDVIVVDMPFGKRVGSKADNVKLYPECIREMERVLRRGKGRAVVLTTERRKVEGAVQSNPARQAWAHVEKRAVFFGGVRGALFSLTRSQVPFQVQVQVAGPGPGSLAAGASEPSSLSSEALAEANGGAAASGSEPDSEAAEAR